MNPLTLTASADPSVERSDSSCMASLPPSVAPVLTRDDAPDDGGLCDLM